MLGWVFACSQDFDHTDYEPAKHPPNLCTPLHYELSYWTTNFVTKTLTKHVWTWDCQSPKNRGTGNTFESLRLSNEQALLHQLRQWSFQYVYSFADRVMLPPKVYSHHKLARSSPYTIPILLLSAIAIISWYLFQIQTILKTKHR